MGVLQTLGNKLSSTIKDKVKLKAITKEDIEDMVSCSIKEHTTFVETYTLLSGDVRTLLYSKVKKNPSSLAAKVYGEYVKNLTPVVRKVEDKMFFETMVMSSKKFIDILTQIEKNIDKLIEDDHISIYKTRISHVTIFGIIKEAEKVHKFNTFMVEAVNHAITENELGSIPGYRSKFLMENVGAVAKITSNVLTKKKDYTFISQISNMKMKNIDLFLVSETDESNLSFLTPNAFNMDILEWIKNGFGIFNLIRWSREKWIDYKHERYQRIKENKEWIETHVALLQLELNGVDPDSPEYIKLVKIIDSYNSILTKIDRDIDKYINS